MTHPGERTTLHRRLVHAVARAICAEDEKSEDERTLDMGSTDDIAWVAADAVLAEVQSAVEAVAGPLLDHWAECPLPPDAGCGECDAWWQARRLLVPLSASSEQVPGHG